MSIRDRLLQPRSERRERVRIEAWEEPDGPELWFELREMTARDRIAWRQASRRPKIGPDGEPVTDSDGDPVYEVSPRWTLELLFRTLHCEATGEPVFSTGDAERLEDLPASDYDAIVEPLAPLLELAMGLNGLAKGAADEAENFTPPAETSAPSSISPESSE